MARARSSARARPRPLGGALVKALALAVALASSGCFTSWAITQGAGRPDILDEGVRESSVPIAGVREQLAVRLPTTIEFEDSPTGQAGTHGPPKPFALTCEVTQHAKDTVYHAAFRYGHTWKWVAASMFVAEAATAAIIYAADSTNGSAQVAAALFAADALGTAVIGLAPRKEVYRTEVRADDTVVRQDCPDGLALAIAGATFPIDAAGRIGEVGNRALDAWMRAPDGALRVTLNGQDETLAIGGDEQCAWNAAHHGARCVRYRPALDASVTLAVPMGTLTSAK